MYAMATPFFKRLRIALGQRTMGTPKDAPDPVPAPDAEILAIASAAPAVALDFEDPELFPADEAEARWVVAVAVVAARHIRLGFGRRA